MARPHAVIVTMSQSYQGKVDEFSSVFHYHSDASVIPTESGWDDLANQVVADLKAIMSNRVTFVRVRIHGPTDGDKEEDQMVLVKDITGVGAGLAVQRISPEQVLVLSKYVGRGPKGGKQILRKFFHLGALSHTGASGDQGYGTAALTSTDKTYYTTRMAAFDQYMIGAGENRICTPLGKEPPGSEVWKCADYVSLRQFKRGRKEKVPA